MKSVRKILRIVLSVIVILIVGVLLLVHFLGNNVLKKGIEAGASKTLSVGVSIDEMKLSILAGSVGFEGLVIDNPPDYEYEKLIEVGSARIAVNIRSLLKDTVNIKEIMFDNVNVVIEQKGLTNNLQEIVDALPKAEKETAPAAEAEKGAKKLHIDKLELTNIVVKAKLLPIPGKADTVMLKLDPIVMTDLGSDDKLDIAKLSSKILVAIATGIAKQGTGVLPENMTDALNDTLGKTAELGKAAAEEGKKLLKEGADTGKDILEGFKGLLKPKK